MGRKERRVASEIGEEVRGEATLGESDTSVSCFFGGDGMGERGSVWKREV